MEGKRGGEGEGKEVRELYEGGREAQSLPREQDTYLSSLKTISDLSM